MRISKNEIPIKIDHPGAVARQKTGFGDASGYGMTGGEHFTMAEGTYLGPLLEGLENDLCQSPHWGYMIGGKLAVSYQDGRSEATTDGDLFYWPPGHTVNAEADSEFVLFSPQEHHTPVLDDVKSQLS
jgi:hypothetical protein